MQRQIYTHEVGLPPPSSSLRHRRVQLFKAGQWIFESSLSANMSWTLSYAVISVEGWREKVA